jgi:hypothetical protein
VGSGIQQFGDLEAMDMVRSRIGRVGLLAGGAMVALVLGACNPTQTNGQGDQQTLTTVASPSSDTSDSSTTGEPSSSSTDTSSPAASTKADPGADPTDCKAASLKLTLKPADAGAGHVYVNVVFTNKSSKTCTMQGFPGVSYVTGDNGKQVGAAAYREGTKGARVTLKPGGSAYAPVDEVNVHNFDPSACHPTSTRGLRIYPPHDTAAMFVAQSGTGCTGSVPGHQLAVKTVVAGTGS